MNNLNAEWRDELYGFIGGLVNNKGGKAMAIGGISDHIHLLVSMPADMAISDLVRELKKSSTSWIRSEKNRGKFSWQEGYGAFTVSPSACDKVRAYILGQEKHHQTKSFSEEFRELLDKAGVEYDPKYLP